MSNWGFYALSATDGHLQGKNTVVQLIQSLDDDDDDDDDGDPLNGDFCHLHWYFGHLFLMQKSHDSVKSPIMVFLSLELVLLSLGLVLLSRNKYPTRDFGHLTGVFASQWYFPHINPCGVFATYISHHVYCTFTRQINICIYLQK